MRYTTYFCAWHDAFLRVTWLIHRLLLRGAAAGLRILCRCDALTRRLSLCHIMTRLYVWHKVSSDYCRGEWMWVTGCWGASKWLLCWLDVILHGTWLVSMCDMMHPQTVAYGSGCGSLVFELFWCGWLACISIFISILYVYARHDSFLSLKSSASGLCSDVPNTLTRLISICDIFSFYTLFLYVIWLILRLFPRGAIAGLTFFGGCDAWTRPLYTRDMPPSHMWHDWSSDCCRGERIFF